MNAVLTARANAWSPERRAKQSAMMRARKIWLKSTGPKTTEGKAASSMNALRHGEYSAAYRKSCRLMNAALARHRRFLGFLTTYSRMKKKFPANELLEPLARALRIEGAICTNLLCYALAASLAGRT